MLLEDKQVCKSIRKSVWESFLISFFLLLFGVVLLSNPENFISVAIHIFAYVAVLVGVLDFFFYFKLPKESRFFDQKFFHGVLFLAFGIVSFLEVELLSSIITVVLGGYLIFQSASRLDLSLKCEAYTKKLWIFLCVFSVCNLILAILLIWNEALSMPILLIVSQILFFLQNICILVGVKHHEKEEA